MSISSTVLSNIVSFRNPNGPEKEWIKKVNDENRKWANPLKIVISILSVLLAAQGMADENEVQVIIPAQEASTPESVPEFHPRTDLPPLSPVEYKKICPFASVSLSSGLGISWRNRNHQKGRAIDVKVGIGVIGPIFFGGGRTTFGTISADYNWFTFYSPTPNSRYFSWGLGAALAVKEGWKIFPTPIPYIPLRFGYQFERGFIDIGANMIVILPIPELRFGMSF